MDVSVIGPSRWELIFTLLSLDGMVPLYEVMGLQVPDKQQFLQALRRVISKNRGLYGIDPIPDYSLATQMLHEIEDSFGGPTVDHFYKWATTVFYWTHQDQPHWSAWDIILLYDDRLQQDVNLPPEKHDAIAQFRDAKRTNDVVLYIVKLKSQPLSDWDSETYSIYSFDNKDDPMFEDDYVDPYSIALSTVEMNRLQLSWGKLMDQLSPTEKTRLWNYGERLLAEEGIEIPEMLCHPDNLHRQI